LNVGADEPKTCLFGNCGYLSLKIAPPGLAETGREDQCTPDAHPGSLLEDSGNEFSRDNDNHQIGGYRKFAQRGVNL